MAEQISISLNLHAEVLKLADGYDTQLAAAAAAAFLTPSIRRRIAVARVRRLLLAAVCASCVVTEWGLA